MQIFLNVYFGNLHSIQVSSELSLDPRLDSRSSILARIESRLSTYFCTVLYFPDCNLTYTSLTGGKVKIIRPASFTSSTNHVHLTGTLPSIPLTLLGII